MQRLIVHRRLRMQLPAAQEIHRGVDGCAAKVRGRQRNILDISTPVGTSGQDTHEDRLQDVLGVGRIAGDTQGARNTVS